MSRFLLLLTACAVCGAVAVRGEDAIKYDGSSQIYHAMIKDSAEAFTKETGSKVEGRDGKTDDAVPALIAGKCNVGGIARPLKMAEKSQSDKLVATLMAVDYIAVFVSKDSKLENITMDQLQKVFSGQITDWKDLGGEAGPIQVIIPQTKTACSKNFKDKVLPEGGFSDKSTITPTAGGVLEEAKGKKAISFISFGALANHPEFKTVKIDGKAPGAADYPISQEVYFVTMGQPEGIVKKYVDFFKQGAGKDIIAKSGLIAK